MRDKRTIAVGPPSWSWPHWPRPRARRVQAVGCRPGRDVATELLESYVVPEPDEDGNEPGTGAGLAADFGDAATMEALVRYGVDADASHRHCFGNSPSRWGRQARTGL